MMKMILMIKIFQLSLDLFMMEKYTWVNGKVMSNKEEVLSMMKMEDFMKVTGKITKKVEKEDI